jgi:hypothetical protein
VSTYLLKLFSYCAVTPESLFKIIYNICTLKVSAYASFNTKSYTCLYSPWDFKTQRSGYQDIRQWKPTWFVFHNLLNINKTYTVNARGDRLLRLQTLWKMKYATLLTVTEV